LLEGEASGIAGGERGEKGRTKQFTWNMNKSNASTFCGRCKQPLGNRFFGMMDTKDRREEKLCYACGVSFGKWWRTGKRQKKR
jgi:hypothetical protein